MLKHSLNFKLSQKLSPQQIQLMKLIQLPTQAFEQRLQEEMVENPALEGSLDDNNESLDDYNDTLYQEQQAKKLSNHVKAFEGFVMKNGQFTLLF